MLHILLQRMNIFLYTLNFTLKLFFLRPLAGKIFDVKLASQKLYILIGYKRSNKFDSALKKMA